MLRPATPLSVTLFLAFVLLLIPVISTPIVKSFKLASSGGVDFGVFGYCKGDVCSGVTVGYPDNTGDKADDFSLPPSTRHSLSSLLVVHAIAALFTLVLLVLSLTAHLHSPSHSPRYLLALLLLTIPALILALLSFLVDVLMFLPHLQWPGWLVLASTILLAASGIISCAMRRTLVSRKARKKRIAENAEMNGENYRARQPTEPPPLTQQPTAPVVDAGRAADKLPDFATFESQKGEARYDDRVPLNARSPSGKSQEADELQGLGLTGAQTERDRFGPPNGRGRGGYGGGPRDAYGNPVPPAAGFGGRDIRPGRGGPGQARGRGGFAPGGRGGYAAPGGPGAMMSRGGGPRGPPPAYNTGFNGGPPSPAPQFPREPSPYAVPYGRGPSPNSAGPPGPPGPGGYGRGPPGPLGPGGFSRPGLPPGPGYARRSPPGGDRGVDAYGRREDAPGAGGGRGPRNLELPPALSIAPPAAGVVVGQAVEMDATTGSPSPSRNSPTQAYGRFGEPDNRGRGGLRPPRQASGAMSPTSIYSSNECVLPSLPPALC